MCSLLENLEQLRSKTRGAIEKLRPDRHWHVRVRLPGIRCADTGTAPAVTCRVGRRLLDRRAAQRAGSLAIAPFLRAVLAESVATGENDGRLHGLVADGAVGIALLDQLCRRHAPAHAVLVRDQRRDRLGALRPAS